MDFLKAEIARKRRQVQEKQVMVAPEKKYFRRGDLAAKEAEEYLNKHKVSTGAAAEEKEAKELLRLKEQGQEKSESSLNDS